MTARPRPGARRRALVPAVLLTVATATATVLTTAAAAPAVAVGAATPTPKPTVKPTAKPTPRPTSKPAAKPPPKAVPRSTPTPTATPTPCTRGTAPAASIPVWGQRQLGVGDPRPEFEGWGVTVAVVSTGVDAAHPQLLGRVVPGGSVDGAGDSRADCLGLGTAVAGAVAAGPAADPGSTSPLRGLAPRARILSVRVPDGVAHPEGGLFGASAQRAGADLATAILTAVQRGADVVVLPAVALPPDPALRRAVARAEAAGVLVVAGQPSSLRAGALDPLGYPEVLVAAPATATGAVDAVEPDVSRTLSRVAAPGTGVGALLPGGLGVVDEPAVAAGWVAGAAALLLDADPRTTPAELRRRLLAGPLNAGVRRLDPAAALAAPPAGAAAGAVPAAGVPRGESGVVGVLPPVAAPEPSRVASRSVGLALGWLGVAALVGLVAAAWVRGHGRRWRPAPPVDLDQVVRRPPVREI